MTTTDLNIDLLRKLCELPGIPGREEAVREFVREEMTPLVDEISVDALGNLIGVRRGQDGPRVKLAANMHLKRLARDNDIPFQMEILTRGGTDAGAMQRARSGAPASAISIPVRYAHTVNETCSPTDVQAAIDLLKAFLEQAHKDDYRER